MHASTLSHPVGDGTVLHVHFWLPEGTPRAVVQIAHGMVEHAGRYARFAQRLTAEGYAVYASDHRGHGRTAAGPADLGHLGDEHGFADAVDDLAALTDRLRAEHPGVPVVLMGHSMGSMLARAYAARYGSRIDGLIVMGTAGDPGVKGAAGLLLARAEARLRGPRARSRFLQAITLGPYNRAFRPNRTGFDWLSRDEGQVDSYIADELCGGVATTAFYRDLFTGLCWVSHEPTMALVPKDLPVHVVSGAQDPVGGAAAVEQVAARLQRAGVRDVTTRTWRGARHEILNETNRDEVEIDLLAWLDARF